MTTAPTDEVIEDVRPFYIEAHAKPAEPGGAMRTITTIRTAATVYDAAADYAEDLSAGNYSAWYFYVRTEPGGPIVATLDRSTWVSLPAELTGRERIAVIDLQRPEGQPDSEESQGAGVTGEPETSDAHLDAKLRKLFSELLGVDVQWSGVVSADAVDPDLLKTLRHAYNPKNERATRLANAHNRLIAFSQFLQVAGGVFACLEVAANREMMLGFLREYIAAVEEFAQ